MIHLKSSGFQALNRVLSVTTSAPIRFATLMHDIDRDVIKKCVQRYRIPNEFSELAMLSRQVMPFYVDCLTADAEKLLQLIAKADALRRPDRFNHFLTVSQACVDDDLNQQREDLVRKAIVAIKSVDISPLQEQNLKGKDFADALRKLQLEKIKEVKE